MNSGQEIGEEKCSSSSSGGEDRDDESYQGITILVSLSSSLNDDDDNTASGTRLHYPPPLRLDPLLLSKNYKEEEEEEEEEEDNDVVEHVSDELATVKSDASLSLTPSMVIPTVHVGVPTGTSLSSFTHPREGETMIGTISPQATTRTTTRIIRNDNLNHPKNDGTQGMGCARTDQHGGWSSLRMMILVVFAIAVASVSMGFFFGYRMGQGVSHAQQEQTVKQYLQEFEVIMAQKESQIKELIVQRENRALHWEIVRAGTIAIASSVVQVVVGGFLTDYFFTEVDNK